MNGMIVHVSAVRTIARLSAIVACIGGGCSFTAQWIMFRKGNFSDTDGAVFIPFVGEHGVYTSKLIGAAWYAGLTMFLLGFSGVALCWSLERRRNQRGDSDKR